MCVDSMTDIGSRTDWDDAVELRIFSKVRGKVVSLCDGILTLSIIS